jgi:iron complex outermembrane receptor protein
MSNKKPFHGVCINSTIPAVIAMVALTTANAALAVDANEAQAADTNSLQEIVVTARKREESVMRTPVVVNVVTTKEITDLKIVDLHDLSETIAPDLHVSYGFGPVGTVVYIRGIGSGDSGTYVDQSVGINIDGVGMSQGNFYRAGSFDMAQIEVLKGPQGLFFGKSTTAGIIALHTADPTPDWQTQVSFGNEFYANEQQVNMFVSGPITNKLGIRLAGYYDSDEGWLRNPNPTPGTVSRVPNSENFAGRLTLKWDDPDTGFRAKFKFGATNEYTRGNASTLNQGFGCPLGVRQTLTVRPYDDCKLDKYAQGYGNAPPYNPNVNWLGTLGNPVPFATGSASPFMGDGRPFGKILTVNSVLQLDYDLMRGLTLTSVSGYSWVKTLDTAHSAFGLNTTFDIAGAFEETDVSEELRLTSSWKDQWVNFMIGALYTPSVNSNLEYASIPAFTVWGQEYLLEKTSSWSGFGQLLLTPFDKWEFDPGVRYTHVYKYFNNLQVLNNFPIPGNNNVNQAPLVPQNLKSFAENNVSPELTVSYHPNEDWTIFASYKKGYKGPGFNAQTFLLTSFNPAIVPGSGVNPFGGEKVEGAEGGLKAILLDRHLNLSITPYFYKYLGLQVSNYNYVTNVIQTTNGAYAKTYGLELSANYRPPVEGLQLNGFVAYNRAQFTSFPFSPCWGGQTAAQGCVAGPKGSQTQNLAGHTPYQAPRWAGSLGAAFDQPVMEYSMRFTVDASFSSGYFTVADLLPDSWQGGWVTLDSSLRFGKPDGSWQVALIGRNLTNKLYVLGASDAGTVTPGIMADAFGFTNRSRQVMLQITVRPNKLL